MKLLVPAGVDVSCLVPGHPRYPRQDQLLEGACHRGHRPLWLRKVRRGARGPPWPCGHLLSTRSKNAELGGPTFTSELQFGRARTCSKPAFESGCRGAAEGSRGPVQGAHPRSGHPARDDRRRAAQLLELASGFSPPEVCRWCRILRRRCPRTSWALLCTRGTRRCVACTVGSQRLEV